MSMDQFVAPGDSQVSDDYGNVPPRIGGSVAALRATITFEDTENTALFEVPAGAVLIDYYANVTTLFNDSGTDLLEIGFADNIDGLVDDLVVSSAALTRAGAGATTPTALLNGTPLAEPALLYAKYTGQNADADAGEADFVLLYTREVTP
jgi:hypothetical protein